MAVFRSDPCGIVCLIITYAAVLYADYVVVRHLVIPTMSDTLWGVVNVVAFNVIIFLLTMSHMRAVVSDPGIVPLPTTGLDFSDLHAGKTMPNMRDGWTVCMKCETYRPPRAHHCRICRRCIRRMDHHCPWINNCVGEFNQKYFIQFLFYVGILSAYATTMVVVSWMMDPGVKGNGKHVKLIHSVLLVVESLLFGMFVIAIGCDQMGAILSDETAVEQVKKAGPRRQKKSSYALMQEVFGRGHPCWWLIPLQFNPVVQVYETQYTV
ncbi:Palmitoyltransferase ZDHHC3 [Mizuhopecten yessoensis]|uniref:Palmitoyltransferase n=2 Tax=Mizuhopecten yessoensis TaxID=6573 RepID=A0A210Q7S2_MIZYE|nr:Palmitoyltransferase ZDHHC3 [Mizuhopecten yessoensis]